MWAKDTPKNRRAVSDGTSVWAANYGGDAVTYDATHTVTPNGANSELDMFVAKYSAADGTAQWATAVGGVGREELYDLAMTTQGPMAVGYSDSASFTMGDIEIHNLQHDLHGKEEHELANHWGIFAVVLSTTDATPASRTALRAISRPIPLSSRPARATPTTRASQTGNFSQPRVLQMREQQSQTGLTGPITGPGTDHCYIDGVCIPKRTGAVAILTRTGALSSASAPLPPSRPPRLTLLCHHLSLTTGIRTACASNAIPM